MSLKLFYNMMVELRNGAEDAVAHYKKRKSKCALNKSQGMLTAYEHMLDEIDKAKKTYRGKYVLEVFYENDEEGWCVRLITKNGNEQLMSKAIGKKHLATGLAFRLSKEAFLGVPVEIINSGG